MVHDHDPIYSVDARGRFFRDTGAGRAYALEIEGGNMVFDSVDAAKTRANNRERNDRLNRSKSSGTSKPVNWNAD